ncbi:MAG: methyltransferase domain-containing protein, partial [Pseudomonadales bacterium]|nr:methyltransferase domain-containing protein [Pseudomonadales bacterium]
LLIKKYLNGGLEIEPLLIRLGIESRVADVSQSGLLSQSIDLILSNDVFEHIELSLLEKVCVEFRRVIRPSGVMSHFIAIGDHFAGFDDKITFINYLQYSDEEWKRYNTNMGYQNRLRLSEYLSLFEKTGFSTELISRECIDKSVLQDIQLAPKFANVSEDDLLTGNCWLRGYIDADAQSKLFVKSITHSEKNGTCL